MEDLFTLLSIGIVPDSALEAFELETDRSPVRRTGAPSNPDFGRLFRFAEREPPSIPIIVGPAMQFW